MSAEELRAKIREVPDFPKPGVLFYDITTLLKEPAAFREAVDLLTAPYVDQRIDVVVGMESRGFIFSAPMAYNLAAGLVPVRKLGKLPAETASVEYALEYGTNTLEIHRDAIQPGQRVLIVDDLLATGGTVNGTVELVRGLGGEVVSIDLARPMDDIRRTLSQYPIKTRLSLTGPLIVARDIAHAKLQERIDRGEGLPDYVKDHPIYYAGPAKTPEGYASGSFGPTTAGRMDSYVDAFMAAGGSFVTLAKGNRGAEVRAACKKHGGFYLGSIGGPAARLAQDCIRKVDLVEYPELGMEAIWRIEVVDFPAFIVIDDKGSDFFAALT